MSFEIPRLSSAQVTSSSTQPSSSSSSSSSSSAAAQQSRSYYPTSGNDQKSRYDTSRDYRGDRDRDYRDRDRDYRDRDRDYRDRDRDYRGGRSDRDRDYRRDDRDRDRGDHRKETRLYNSNAYAPANASTPRKFFRKGPTGWDVKPDEASLAQPIFRTKQSGSTELPLLPSDTAFVDASFIDGPGAQIRHARRLYVGGLENVSDHEINKFFTDLIRRSILHPLPDDANPVISVYINIERKFAFVELMSIELTNALMKADGLLFRNHPLKLRRPGDYAPQTLPPDLVDKCEPLDYSKIPGAGTGNTTNAVKNVPSLTRTSGLVSNLPSSIGGNVPPPGAPGTRESLNRIFIANIPSTMNENQLRELMSSFGPLLTLDWVKGPQPGTHKGYAFCEYTDPNLTDIVITALNGFRVTDRKNLSVSRAIKNQNNAGKSSSNTGTSSSATGSNSIPIGNGSVPEVSNYGGNNVQPSHVSSTSYATNASTVPVPSNVMVPQGIPTRVVCLDNMVSMEELTNNVDYQDLVEEITEECSQYGSMQISIPRPPLPGAGRVFLFYSELMSAIRAATALAGRRFDSRTVLAKYYDEHLYSQGILTN